MVFGSEADGVAVTISPRKRFDMVRVVQLRPQNRAVTHTLSNLAVLGVEERFDRPARIGHPERRVTAGMHATAGVEHVVTQHNVLAGYVGLIQAAVVVAPDHAAVGRRPLRPVDPPVLERELFGWMV